MNDRYLFKAKRIDWQEFPKEEQWVCGYYVFCRKHHYILPVVSREAGYDERYDEWIEIEEDTLCQCTGLKDKNGNLIWENDIAVYWDTYSTENGYAESNCMGKVVWDNETISFQVTNRLSAESYEVLEDCSVIGNIFDSPELLEVE